MTMVPIKALGSLFGLANGAWAVYIAESALNTVYHCPANGCPPEMFAYVPYAQALTVVGGMLVADSLVSFKGYRAALLLAAILSAGVLGLVAAEWGEYGPGSLYSSLLSVAAAAVCLVASRSPKDIPDQAHPLNLPVFG